MSELEPTNDLMTAIAAYRSNNSEDKLNDLYNELINAVFMAPVNLDPKPIPDENGKVNLSPDTKISFFIMRNQAQQSYYLLFSCKDAFNNWNIQVKPDTVTLTFDDLIRFLNNDVRIAGILVDPMDGNMVFDREMLMNLDARVKEIEGDNPKEE